MRSSDDDAVPVQKFNALAMELMICDHVVRESPFLKPIDEAEIRGKLMWGVEGAAARLRPEIEDRPAQRGVTDAAAVRVLVICAFEPILFNVTVGFGAYVHVLQGSEVHRRAHV